MVLQETLPEAICAARTAFLARPSLLESKTMYASNPTRGAEAASVIRDIVLPTIDDGRPVNCCIVGIGLNCGPIQQPFEPYVVAANLEHLGVDYKMTLIDIDPKPLLHIKTQSHIFLAQNSCNILPMYSDGWQEYLGLAQVGEMVIHEQTDDLLLRGDYNMEPDFKDRLFREGIYMTSIPRTFQEKLENGEISFMVGNVATTDVSSLGDFDFVSCMNMLYMLPKEGQQLALWNMIQSLKKPHGTMLINDGLDGLEHTKIPLLSQFGGWLNPDVASNMYSSELRLWSKDSFYLSALLTRNQ